MENILGIFLIVLILVTMVAIWRTGDSLKRIADKMDTLLDTLSRPKVSDHLKNYEADDKHKND